MNNNTAKPDDLCLQSQLGQDGGKQYEEVSWFTFKKRLSNEHGFRPGFDYTGLYQHYSSSPAGEKNAVGGIARAFGTWAFAGRESGNTTSVTYKVENRHRIGTDLAPQDAGIAAGSTLPTGTTLRPRHCPATCRATAACSRRWR